MRPMVPSEPEAMSRSRRPLRHSSAVDALILGGGIAGLWILDELKRRGRSCLLIERDALGAGQTIWSQGIIHGGLKYTLAGLMSASAEAIREMPGVWRECLAGRREPDLSASPPRADHCHLWQTGSLASRLGMIGARFGLRVAPVVLAPDERPPALRGCPGLVARLDEQVIDPAGVLRALFERNRERILRGELVSAEAGAEPASGRAPDVVRATIALACNGQPRSLTVAARRIILAAGNGNADLRSRLGLDPGRMQVRPLRMVLARGERLPVLNGHCVDGGTTRVTITTARDPAGRAVWQVGGEAAERGWAMNPDDLLAFARDELLAVLPGVDLAGCEFAWYDAPRAEAANAGRRPDDASIIEEGPILTCWPTKLALAPSLAARIADRVGTTPSRPTGAGEFDGFDRPAVAEAPWQGAVEWRVPSAGRSRAG